MANMLRKIVYKNDRETTYERHYSNSVFVQLNPSGDVVIDFCEEYAPPNTILTQTFNGAEFTPDFEHPDTGVLNVNRDMKCSIVMSKQTALNLAEYLIRSTESEDE